MVPESKTKKPVISILFPNERIVIIKKTNNNILSKFQTNNKKLIMNRETGKV